MIFPSNFVLETIYSTVCYYLDSGTYLSDNIIVQSKGTN